jgi:hypothetical protein
LDGVPPSGDFGSAALSWSFLALAIAGRSCQYMYSISTG